MNNTKLLFIFIFISLLFSCNQDESIHDAWPLRDAPFVTFNQVPENFLLDMFEPETAAFSSTLLDQAETVVEYSLDLIYERESDTLTYENFFSTTSFPHDLHITLVDIAEKLGLDISTIEIGTRFEFVANVRGTDGLLYNGRPPIRSFTDSASGVFDDPDNPTIETAFIDSFGVTTQGGNVHETLSSRLSLRGAMNFSLTTFVSPPPAYRFTSFEEPPAPAAEEYCKNLGPTVSEDLTNNPGQPFVDWVATGDGPENEIGFNSEFIATRSNGFECEQIGVFVSPDTAGRWTDGMQGYRAEDIDGILKITFDRVEIPAEHPQTGIRVDVFMAETGYESSDFIKIDAIIEQNGTTETLSLLDISNNEIEAIDGQWMTVDSGLMDGVDAYQLIVEIRTGSNSERFQMDQVLIYLPRE